MTIAGLLLSTREDKLVLKAKISKKQLTSRRWGEGDQEEERPQGRGEDKVLCTARVTSCPLRPRSVGRATEMRKCLL